MVVIMIRLVVLSKEWDLKHLRGTIGHLSFQGATSHLSFYLFTKLHLSLLNS